MHHITCPILFAILITPCRSRSKSASGGSASFGMSSLNHGKNSSVSVLCSLEKLVSHDQRRQQGAGIRQNMDGPERHMRRGKVGAEQQRSGAKRQGQHREGRTPPPRKRGQIENAAGQGHQGSRGDVHETARGDVMEKGSRHMKYNGERRRKIAPWENRPPD